MTGDSIPYALCRDNLMLSLFMASLLGIAYIMLCDGNSIVERLKNIFYYTNSGTPYNTRTGISRFGNFLLHFNTILYCTITVTGYMQRCNMIADGEHLLFSVFFATLFLLMLLTKVAIYYIVNITLFTGKQADEWNRTILFTNQISGFLMLPITTTLILYPQTNHVIFWGYIILISVIYIYTLSIRCFNIIFNKSFYFLDIFLYLCAIELVPFALLWQATHQTNLFLMIKF